MAKSKLDEYIEENPDLAPWFEANAQHRAVFESLLAAPSPLQTVEAQLRKDYEERLLKHREWLSTTQFEVSTSYDKTLLALATGALALSVAFVRSLTETPSADAIQCLLIAWASLVLSLVALLASIGSSRVTLKHAVDFTDLLLKQPPSIINPRAPEDEPKPRRWAERLTYVFTGLASLLFIVGVCLLLYFATQAIFPGVESMSQRPAGGTEKNGFVPPPPPPSPAIPQQPAPAPGPSPSPPSGEQQTPAPSNSTNP